MTLDAICPFYLSLLLCLSAMTTRRPAARRVEEDIASTGAPPQDNQASPLVNQPLHKKKFFWLAKLK